MSTYHRPVSNTLWLKRKPYILFMIRELTSVFVAGYCIFLLVLVYKLTQGANAYDNFMAALNSPSSVALHLITLVFVLYHTITWFNLTPKILVLYRGEERIPQWLVAGTFYAGWAVVSVIVAWLVLTV
ncbi:MAG: fumarate reductase subunit C [Candidatus Marinimicrobia bacterium]|nr:fumarate reductase subunit C [Candidatus Neomarinimicrobiota bacterium]MDP7026319.1 fumarate reductase subunit C [Candidatus Neomarinimicrobiota bacterium]